MQLSPVQAKMTKPVSSEKRRAISVDDDQSVVGSLTVVLDINIDSAHYADSLSRVRAQFRVARFNRRGGLVGPRCEVRAVAHDRQRRSSVYFHTHWFLVNVHLYRHRSAIRRLDVVHRVFGIVRRIGLVVYTIRRFRSRPCRGLVALSLLSTNRCDMASFVAEMTLGLSKTTLIGVVRSSASIARPRSGTVRLRLRRRSSPR